MRMTGRDCCGEKYSKYEVVFRNFIEPLVENPDPENQDHWQNRSVYYLAKTAWKANGPSPRYDILSSPPLDDGSLFNSYRKGDWKVLLAEYVYPGFQQREWLQSDNTRITAGVPWIGVYANTTNEYIYILTYYDNVGDYVEGTINPAIYEGLKEHKLKLFKVHANTQSVVYAKDIVLSFGNFLVFGDSLEYGQYGDIVYYHNVPLPRFLPSNGTLLSESPLLAWISEHKLFLSDIGHNYFSSYYSGPGLQIPHYRIEPGQDINEAYVWIEIDLDEGEVVKEIINYTNHLAFPQPRFIRNQLIQDLDNVVGLRYYEGNAADHIPYRAEIARGKLDYVDNQPAIVDYTSIRMLFYTGELVTVYGIPNFLYNIFDMNWGQDCSMHTYISLRYSISPSPNIKTEIYNDDDLVLDVTLTDNRYIYIEPLFLDGYLRITTNYLNDPPNQNQHLTELQVWRSNGTPIWTRVFIDHEFSGGWSTLDTLFNSNDKFICVNFYTITFEDYIGENEVIIDSSYKYTEYVGRFAEAIYSDIWMINIKNNFIMPFVMCHDPTLPNDINYYDPSTDSPYPEYQNKLVYDPVETSLNNSWPPHRLNIVRLTKYPDTYFGAHD